jgi:hypothetical protein
MRWVALVVIAACSMGCRPPRQYQGMIHVDHEGLAARMNALCRLGLAPGEAADACTPAHAPARPSQNAYAPDGPLVIR